MFQHLGGAKLNKDYDKTNTFKNLTSIKELIYNILTFF